MRNTLLTYLFAIIPSSKNSRKTPRMAKRSTVHIFQ